MDASQQKDNSQPPPPPPPPSEEGNDVTDSNSSSTNPHPQRTSSDSWILEMTRSDHSRASSSSTSLMGGSPRLVHPSSLQSSSLLTAAAAEEEKQQQQQQQQPFDYRLDIPEPLSPASRDQLRPSFQGKRMSGEVYPSSAIPEVSNEEDDEDHHDTASSSSSSINNKAEMKKSSKTLKETRRQDQPGAVTIQGQKTAPPSSKAIIMKQPSNSLSPVPSESSFNKSPSATLPTNQKGSATTIAKTTTTTTSTSINKKNQLMIDEKEKILEQQQQHHNVSSSSSSPGAFAIRRTGSTGEVDTIGPKVVPGTSSKLPPEAIRHSEASPLAVVSSNNNNNNNNATATQLRQAMIDRVSQSSLQNVAVATTTALSSEDKTLPPIVRESYTAATAAAATATAPQEQEQAIRRKSKELEENFTPTEVDLEGGREDEEEEEEGVAAYLAPSELDRNLTLGSTITATSSAATTVISTTLVGRTTSNTLNPTTTTTTTTTMDSRLEDQIPISNGPVVVEGVTTTSLQRSNARKNHYISSCLVMVVILVVALGIVLGGRGGDTEDNGSSDGIPPSSPTTGTTTTTTTMEPGGMPIATIPTSSPTMAPTTLQLQRVIEEIARQFPNNQNIISRIQPGTPSYQAALWLAHDENSSFSLMNYPLDINDLTTVLQFRQRFVLATLYFATGGGGDGGGDTAVVGGGGSGTWRDTCHFLSSQHVCEWQCIIPSQITPSTYALTSSTTMGVQCGQNFGLDPSLDDHVVSLELVRNGLVGTLPEEIEGLKNLFFLNLFENTIQGTIPFGHLSKQLVNLILPVNNLSGTIPEEKLYDLTKLRTLWLDYNQLSGTIPSQIANFLPVLEVVSMGSNLFTGPIPQSLLQVEGTSTIILSNNLLSGTFPEMSVSALLGVIDIQKNFVGGSISESISNLIEAWLLSFFDNALTGTVPSTLGRLTNMKLLGLAENNLIGNPLAGDHLWRLTNLELLTLGGNDFTGSLDDRLGNLSQLELFGIENNMIVGTIPPIIGNLTSLTTLTLSNNQFTGLIPTELAQLTNLAVLSLQSNLLSGSLDGFCESSPSGIFQSDCLESDVSCSCCSVCCDRQGTCEVPFLT